MKRLKTLLFTVAISGMLASQGQTLSSTYSGNGVGIFSYQGLPHNMGMGEVGIAAPTPWGMNLVNPSFLPLNRYSMFQVGIEVERRSMQSSDFTANKTSGGLRFLNYSFPMVNGKWSSSFGLAPYSNSSLQRFSREELPDGNVELTRLINTGGLSSFHWSNGINVSGELFLGFRATYLFGSLGYEELKAIEDVNSFSSAFTDETAYSALKLDVSAGYRLSLAEKKRLIFGMVYEFERELSGDRDIEFSGDFANESTTIEEEVTFGLPSSLGIGISYQVENKLTVGSDFTFTNWSNAGRSEDNFINTTKMAFGAEFIPDYASVNSYWKRVSYRLGINFDKLPYLVNGQEVNEVGVNFGASFPFGLSSLDAAFKYGTLGSLDNDLIRENYFRIVIGATINDRWFIKRRYD